MSRTSLIVAGSILVLLAPAAGAIAGDHAAGRLVVPTIHEEIGRRLGDLVEQFQGLGSQVREHFAPRDLPRPLISIMLSHRDELGLSAAQVQAFERLRAEFQKEAIRADADLKVAETDLGLLLSAEPRDMTAIEAKIREIEKRRADLRVTRVRTIESGRALLSADQREKLRTLLAQQHPPAMRAFPAPPPPPSRL